MSLQVRAYSPQLLREYPSNVGGEEGVRRAPIILVELTDAHLEQVRSSRDIPIEIHIIISNVYLID